MGDRIPVFKPSIPIEQTLLNLRATFESGWLGPGPNVKELEELLAREVGDKYFICTSSCTAALHLAVAALKLPAGSRVLTSPISFVSTAAAICYEGHMPVFGAVNDEGMLDPTAVHPRCDAIISVHLGGSRCRCGDRPRWQPGIEGARVVPLIEDCAHAFGSPWVSQPHGATMRCWSFQAVKTLPMGDGGGVSTNDRGLAEWIRRQAWMGIDKSTFARDATPGGYVPGYQIQALGCKYGMNDVTAAIGLAGLGEAGMNTLRRQAIARAYREALSGLPLMFPRCMPEESSCHFYPMWFDSRKLRERAEMRLREDYIDFARHYMPLFDFDCFVQGGSCESVLPNRARDYYERVLVLPMFPSMTEPELVRVIRAVKGAI